MERQPAHSVQAQPVRTQEVAGKSQPVLLDPKMFQAVAGGSPKGTWLETAADDIDSPKGTW